MNDNNERFARGQVLFCATTRTITSAYDVANCYGPNYGRIFGRIETVEI